MPEHHTQPERRGVTNYEIINGDCLVEMPKLIGRGIPAHAFVTDPPYGVELGVGKDMRGGSHGLAKQSYDGYEDTYENFCRVVPPAIELCLTFTRRGAAFVGPHFQELPKASAMGGVYCPAATGRHRWGFKTLLPVLFYGTDPTLHKGARPTVITSTAAAEKNGHPCPKPVEWMVWLVERVTLPGETVIDPFMGGGTTGVACVLTGRNFIGIEMSEQYCQIGEACLKRASGVAADIPRFNKRPIDLPLFGEAGKL
jgi:DNA modification methylase